MNEIEQAGYNAASRGLSSSSCEHLKFSKGWEKWITGWLKFKPAESKEYVDLIASGYEWICPSCEAFHHEIEVTETVTCTCGKTFKTNTPEHAYS